MSKKSTSSGGNIPLYLSITLVAGLVAAYFFIPEVQDFFNEAWQVLTSNDEERIRAWVDGFGWYGPLVLIIAMIAQMFLLVIPSVALMVVAILAYGPVWGSILVFAAVFCASSVGYFIGNLLGEKFVLKLLGKKNEQKVEGFLEDYGLWAVIITRINPFLSNDAISFVCGILKMNYWKFISATLIGIAPLTIFIAILGRNSDSLKTGLIWGSVVSLLGFGAYVWWDKKRKKNA